MPRYDLMFSVVTMNSGPGISALNREIREIELERQSADIVQERPRHRARTQVLAVLTFLAAGLGTTEFAQYLHI